MPAENTFHLYNTLTRRVEPVEPIDPGHLRFYSCGPTVYSYAHIGNFRSFLTADLILRTAQALGWRTTYVTNVTDVGHLTEDDYADVQGEDRMEKALRSKEGARFANIWDLARYYTDVLIQDWHALNLREPAVRPRATEHVTQQIDAIADLIERGHAYRTERGVYFSVASFPAYGKLSGNLQAEELEQAVREVVVDPDKRDPRDFALWKIDPKHLMQWHSPFGRGFPGWHIECSVMSTLYLGETFDLHAGGEDLIFPHHECEIAQAESRTGKPFARHWVHTRFLQVEGEKMSKSKGNFYTVRDLIAPEAEGGRGVDPLALRLALISGKYREPLNFTFQNLRAAAKHVQRFREAARKVQEGLENARTAASPEEQHQEQVLVSSLRDDYAYILESMLDDLNTPKAVAHALALASDVLNYKDPKGLTLHGAQQAQVCLEKMNDLLGVVYPEQTALRAEQEAADPLEQEVETLLALRAEARKARDFSRSDAIRDQLEEMGIEVMDTPEGTKWRKKLQV